VNAIGTTMTPGVNLLQFANHDSEYAGAAHGVRLGSPGRSDASRGDRQSKFAADLTLRKEYQYSGVYMVSIVDISIIFRRGSSRSMARLK
jgi:hypothetical protein